MTLRRTDAEFWQMTPAQLVALVRVHNRVHAGAQAVTDAKPTAGVRRGTGADLARFASMPLT